MKRFYHEQGALIDVNGQRFDLLDDPMMSQEQREGFWELCAKGLMNLAETRKEKRVCGYQRQYRRQSSRCRSSGDTNRAVLFELREL